MKFEAHKLQLIPLFLLLLLGCQPQQPDRPTEEQVRYDFENFFGAAAFGIPVINELQILNWNDISDSEVSLKVSMSTGIDEAKVQKLRADPAIDQRMLDFEVSSFQKGEKKSDIDIKYLRWPDDRWRMDIASFRQM